MATGSLQRIIVITGPTATGKSAVGVRLAKLIDGEIVSADSMQVYRHMDIGTAKPMGDEMCGVPHHLIDIIPPWEDYSVARYVEDASECVDDIFRRGKQPILVGGSGLYIDSLLAGRKFLVRGDPEQRRKLEDEFDKIGGDAMLVKLRSVDEISAAKLHSNDKKRIVRALEAFLTTGKPLSLHDLETVSLPRRYESIKFALTYSDRAELYNSIDRRVDTMITKGLIHEVRTLFDIGVSRCNTSMQAIGYKEISDVLISDPDISDAADILTAAEKIKMESRRYAKRQLTWLRRDNEIIWITWSGTPDHECGAQRLMEILYETK